MLIDNAYGRHLINELAYQLVRENAPQELPLYVGLRDRYFADPKKYIQASETKDEALAFGLAEAVETFTYMVFPLVTPILAHVITEAKKALQDEIGEKAVQWLRSLLNSPNQPQPIFSQAQLAAIEQEINHIIENETRRLNLRKTQAYTMKNAIMTKLALATKA